MPANNLKLTEYMILVAFPIVLFAGCAGSDIKPLPEEKIESIYPDQQSFSNSNTSLESESIDISDVGDDSKQRNTIANNVFGPKIPATMNTLPTDDLSEKRDGAIVLDTTVESQYDLEVIAPPVPDKKIFFFDTDNHSLSEVQNSELQQHADYLKSNVNEILKISGHADVRGSESHNQSLSEKRALEVYNLLIELGVPNNQLVTKSFGELIPLHTENNWIENRRIELEYTDPVILTSN